MKVFNTDNATKQDMLFAICSVPVLVLKFWSTEDLTSGKDLHR